MERKIHPPTPVSTRFLPVTAFALVLGLALPALAGEIKVGAKPFETDDEGRLAGSQPSVEQLDNIPGDDSWEIYLWAELDRGAPGPLYVQFWDKFEGKDIKVPWAYEDTDYDGSPYRTLEFTIEDNVGFNKDHTYRIKIVQFDEGKEIVLAQGAKVKLLRTREEEAEEEDGENEEKESSAQDVADSLGGDGNDGSPDAPPEVTPPAQKRGCSVDDRSCYGFSGVVVLMVLGASLGRRR